MSQISNGKMIDIREFHSTLPFEFHGLATPEIQPLLRELPPSFWAVGASKDGRPIGLAVVQWQEGTKAARLLSLIVLEHERRQGIGRQLLKVTESLLGQKGVQSIVVEYLESDKPQSETNAFLQVCGFAKPSPGIYIWSGSLQVASDLMWVEMYKLPKTFSIKPWSALTNTEREVIDKGNGIWYPPILSPFADEEEIDRERSLALLYKGEVVGWMIMEAFDVETILFKTMFVQRRFQRIGRGVALVAEVWRRMLKDSQFHKGMFFVEAENEDMVRFMHHHISHPDIHKETLWRTFKSL